MNFHKQTALIPSITEFLEMPWSGQTAGVFFWKTPASFSLIAVFTREQSFFYFFLKILLIPKAVENLVSETYSRSRAHKLQDRKAEFLARPGIYPKRSDFRRNLNPKPKARAKVMETEAPKTKRALVYTGIQSGDADFQMMKTTDGA